MMQSMSATATTLKSKYWIAIGLVVLAGALAGCTVTYDTTVSSEGELDRVDVEIELGEQNYNLAQQQAEAAEQEYDNVAEFVFSDQQGNMNLDPANWDSVEFEDDGDSTVGFIATGGPQPQETSDTAVQTTVNDDAGEVTYVDQDGIEGNSQQTNGAEINWEYTVRMPGEIIDTNGKVSDTGVVTWTSDANSNVSEFRVTSEQTGVDQTTTNSDGIGPGFGVAAALAAVVSLVVLVIRRRD